MGNDKSIIHKFTETVKGLADSAAEALKAEEPPKADQTAAAYMPFAAEGLVSDPLLVPPVAAQPVRKKKRAAPKSAPGAARKSARKSANKSAPSRSSKAARKSTAAKAARKATKARTARGRAANGKTAKGKTGKRGGAQRR
jgi:hypothetical protein